jgi:hypothetical protein
MLIMKSTYKVLMYGPWSDATTVLMYGPQSDATTKC